MWQKVHIAVIQALKSSLLEDLHSHALPHLCIFFFQMKDYAR